MHLFVEIIQWIVSFTILFELFVIFRRINNQVYCHLYIFCVSMLVSSYGYLLHLNSATQNALFLTSLFTWAGRIFAVVCSFRFVHSVCEYRIPQPFQSLDFVIGIIALLFLTTTEKTGLFFSNMRMETEGEWHILSYDKGIAYYIWDVVVLIALVIMLTRLILTLRRTRDSSRKKMYGMFLLGTAANIMTAPFTMLPIARYYDFNQLGFLTASIVMVIAMLRYNLGEIEQSTKDYMFNELSAGVIALDKDGMSAYYNTVAYQVFPDLATDVQGVVKQINGAYQSGEAIPYQEKVYTPEEKNLENGKKLFILNDSTRHYQHIREVEEQRRIAENANKAKSDFLANMSHEIRTPLNTVLGMDEMILRASGDTEVREYAEDIRNAGNTLLTIINDILDLSRIESGKMELVPKPYHTASLICDIVNMIRFRAEEKELAFEIQIAEDIPSEMIGDDVRLRQILMNLLTNAVKYTKSGSVWFRACRAGGGQLDDGFVTLHFEVEDTGIGIKQEDMSRLFEDFERLDMQINRNTEGTGLGLPITLRLLQMMDSELRVESTYGKGSVFSFDLRQEVADDTPVGDFRSTFKDASAKGSAFEASFIAPEARLLVVDDNDMNRRVFLSLLKSTGIEITEAADGHAAIALASKEHFDIIFMDHMMPGMDGVEAMKGIREIKGGPCDGTPIVALTANAIVGAKEKYLEEGFDGFLSKPLAYDKLEGTLRDLLPAEKLEEPLQEERSPELSGETDIDSDDLPMIFGLDWNVALMRLRDKEILDAVLEDFALAINPQADKLQEFKDGLSGTLDDYRILVHAMKSSSASVGIIPLSGMAALLEKAAREENLETIDRLHEVFLTEWRGYRKPLLEYLGANEEDASEKEEISPAVLSALLDMLSGAMADMDIDTADEAIAKLSGYVLPDPVAAEYDGLRSAVASLDQETTSEILGRLRFKDTPPEEQE